jgi:hypothetical protein
MRSLMAAHPALSVQRGTLAKNGAQRASRAERPADREAEYLPVARQLRARYRRSLCCLTVSGIAKALMKLAGQGRIDVAALARSLDGWDERELVRVLRNAGLGQIGTSAN